MSTPDQAQDATYIDSSELSRWEYLGMASGVLLFISLFLPWYTTGPNKDSAIASAGVGPNSDATAWQTFRIMDWLLLALSFAPFILAWIVARRHKLDWPTGEVTMVTGLIGIFLVLCNGVILGKPDPGIEVGLAIGWFLGLLGCVGIFTAGLIRQGENAGAKGRKPPGSV